MAWRLEWRTTARRTVKGVAQQVPGEIHWEDGHDRFTVGARARDVIEAGACWAFAEDLGSDHKGSSRRSASKGAKR